MNRRNFLQKLFSLGASSFLPSNINATQNSPIKNMFLEMQNISELKLEKNFKPYYKGEEFPTIILIGDIHEESSFMSTLCFEHIDHNQFKFIYEKDESFKKEVDAAKILNQKYAINFFGIEGEIGENYNNTFSKNSLIGKGLLEIPNVSIIGLDEKKLNSKHGFGLLLLPYIYSRENYTRQTQEKFPEIKEIYLNKLRKEIWFNDKLRPKEKASKEFLIKECQNLDDYTKIKLRINNIEEYKILEYSNKDMFLSIGYSYEKFLEMEKEIKFQYKKELYLFETEFRHFFINFDREMMYERDGYAAERMAREMKNKNIKTVVIIFGKAHMEGLVFKFKKIYDDKVNIYIAK